MIWLDCVIFREFRPEIVCVLVRSNRGITPRTIYPPPRADILPREVSLINVVFSFLVVLIKLVCMYKILYLSSICRHIEECISSCFARSVNLHVSGALSSRMGSFCGAKIINRGELTKDSMDFLSFFIISGHAEDMLQGFVF